MQYRDQSFIRHATALPQAEAVQSVQNEMRNALRFLRRRSRHMLLSALIGGALLGGYALVSQPTFRATAVIALDPNALSVLDTAEERAHKQDTPMQDSARVDSLVQVLQSNATLLRVIGKLDLQDDPEFNGTQPSSVRSAIAWVTSLVVGVSPPPSRSDRIDRATINLGLGQTVERAAGTYIVTVSVLSKDPEKAAIIANAFGDDYLDDQRRTDIETTHAAADWMKSRLNVLGDEMLKTQGAVAEFKSANAIATSDGKSIADLMLSNISTKLSDAMGQSAQAKAKLDRIEHVNAQTTLDLSVTDALSDDVITDLRKKYLDLQGRAANIAAQYGQNHAAAVKLRAEAEVAMASIRNELKRLEEASRSDYEVAQLNERATRASLNDQFLKTGDVGRSQVKLQELDSMATTAELAYEETLKRYTDTVQKESFPMVQARIIARAVPPNEKFKPKTVLLIAIGTAGGVALNLGYALVSELFDKRIYSRQQAERASGTDCLGVFPLTKARSLRAASTFKATGRAGRRQDLPWDYVVQQPRSAGAEAMRSIKLSFDQSHRSRGERVLGITSALEGEGKSTVAASAAHLLSSGGARVLLVDGDLRRPVLSDRLHGAARVGLPDVLQGLAYGSALVSDPTLGLDFLPARTEQGVVHPDGLLASPAMEGFLRSASAVYDYIVVDLPPMLPMVDVRSVAPFIDGFVMVVAWGQTEEDVLAAALDAVPVVREKLLGLLLNKVELNRLAGRGEATTSYHSSAYQTG